MRPVVLIVLALACAACSSAQPVSVTTTVGVQHPVAKPAGLPVRVVGPLRVNVPGIVVHRGSLGATDDARLVLVDARVATLDEVHTAALAHPDTHYAIVGATTQGERARNLVGLALQDDQAAFLAGIVAGLVASNQSANAPRVEWVGPEENKLAAAFGRGVHSSSPGTAVLHQWSRSIPARCKEAALTGLTRGALVVMAHGGVCAAAAIAAAHQQNVPGLQLSDFELPSVAAEAIARDAAAGVFHGDEDILFGASTGAVAVRALDPLIPVATVVQARAAAEELANGISASG